MARLNFACLLPASWHFSLSLSMLSATPRQRVIGIVIFFTCFLLIFLALLRHWPWSQATRNSHLDKYLDMFENMEATDTEDSSLNFGVVVDCGSSGSRVFVYYWPPHNGNPHSLLDIRQMKDRNRIPVVKKIKPGISTLASTPDKASDYLRPLLSFAADHIPKKKHKETLLYILCTAGMRLLPESQQVAILEDLNTDIPLQFDFLFSGSHAEVISGKQEGVYAWIGINFVLGRFDHAEEGEDTVVTVTTDSQTQHPFSRKRTVGVLDMGGASLQIAYEVPTTVGFASPKQEEAAKSVLAEFNLGCDVQHTQHVYRVYVSTFLGFGGNIARQRYEDHLINSTVYRSRVTGDGTGMSATSPSPDPCLPVGLTDTVQRDGQTVFLRGQGDWSRCQEVVRPFLGKTNGSTSSLIGGVYQAPINFHNSEFYGFSEFYYCMEDVLRIGGHYSSTKYTRAATDYCATKWSTLKQRLDSKLFTSQTDLHRLKYQCFKSAWMYEVLHTGFQFPKDYPNLKTAQLVYDKEVQWTLGAILFKTRFLPLRDLQVETFRQSHSSWIRFSFVYNHYLIFACILVVVLAILLYVLRLRRIHRREQRSAATLDLLWVEGGEPLKG
ncbi:ectonucleoside triphosphate diphosphohydrolase 7-like isoform X1 [Polyodon spathula]|uniref:ectonucleoside triphosphate diphosphohydrolase 7-like isoform X1 n=1 Tax=Polyodon spathula TaxID=7913 RepID=UPI001B7F5EC2|nr:ectonucleoside triphosphate diphosphohydrolase 7-like isoform X1 [Polyodon spathula]XP_041117431.1 ectonucleoside triphosphate diphosphohydrolase 7-like isoform X1 [Polyodon spathula]XP_041117432.1 ectonucleoside triphosphate diphosphohydrolase 7-like isoform X1 [Polyodon spathula]